VIKKVVQDQEGMLRWTEDFKSFGNIVIKDT
jgi:hypothetical protein